MVAPRSLSLLDSKEKAFCSWRPPRVLFPLHPRLPLVGMYFSERRISEACWVLWRSRSEPSSPGGLEDTSPICCDSASGYLQGKLRVGRVSSPRSCSAAGWSSGPWSQEAKLLKEQPRDGRIPGGEWKSIVEKGGI